MMAGQKFIEDSDDEDHPHDNPSPLAVANASPMSQHAIALRNSPLSKVPHPSGESSTGSTDVLSRAIEVARDNLLKSSSDGPLSTTKPLLSSYQLPESPAAPRGNLRRATTAFPERKEKKPLKTYGSRASQDDSRILRRSDLDLRDHSPLPSTIATSSIQENGSGETNNAEAQDGSEVGPTKERETGQGSIAHADHALRPELVNNAGTISAQLATKNIVDSLTTTSDNIPDGNTKLLTPAETPASHGSFAGVTLPKPPNSEPELIPDMAGRNPAQAEEASSLKLLDTKSKKRPRFLLDLPDSCVAKTLPINDDCYESPTKRARIDGKESSGNQRSQDDTYDELSLSVSRQLGNNGKSKQSKTKRLHETDKLDDNLGSDDIGIGLPVENYQPRPSRSRSGRPDGELLVPTDFSKKPEALAKRNKKNKRRKTTAFEQLVHEGEDEMDIFQIKIPSKDSEPSPEQLKIRDLQPTTATDGADHPPQPEPDIAQELPNIPPPKKRGRPKKQAPEPHEEPTTKTPRNPSPPKNPNSKTQPSKQRKFPLEIDSDLSSADENFPRPTDLKSNISNPPPPPPTNPKKNTPIPIPIARSPSPSKPDPPPQSLLQTPPKSATAAAKGPDKHSPINSGKVAYRVGLSKNARIEPLLRVVRK